jgi:hypothetical protein
MARPVAFKVSNQKPESAFKRAALKWLRLAYGPHLFHLAISGGPYQRPGSPDCVMSIRGVFVAIEWKSPGGRVGPKQQELIDEILAAGGRAGVVSTWEELKSLFDGLEPVQKGMEWIK